MNIKLLIVLLLMGGSVLSPVDNEPAYTGFIERATCSVIQGWAADMKRPNVPIRVLVFSDGVLIESVLANQERKDIADYLGDDGLHGFLVATPYPLKDSKDHTIVIKFETSDAQLVNSGLPLRCEK